MHENWNLKEKRREKQRKMQGCRWKCLTWPELDRISHHLEKEDSTAQCNDGQNSANYHDERMVGAEAAPALKADLETKLQHGTGLFQTLSARRQIAGINTLARQTFIDMRM